MFLVLINNYVQSRLLLYLVQVSLMLGKLTIRWKLHTYILVKHTEWPDHIITDSLLSPKTFGCGSSQNIYGSLKNAESSLKQILYKIWISNREKWKHSKRMTKHRGKELLWSQQFQTTTHNWQCLSHREQKCLPRNDMSANIEMSIAGRKEKNAYLWIEKEATDLMRDATAPTLAASTAPCNLYCTVSP